ncbi:MAG: sulfurtransferase [Ignavibacteriae bacterium]|nr:MAG: sulfurtransferase [Ignavibacteriota bacterium]
MANSYAHPEVLVDTEWVSRHRSDPNTRLVEVDVDTQAYKEAHIPNAVGWNWQTQLSDQVRRDLVSKKDLEQLLGNSGIDNNTSVILYGDNNNWFAAWAFWQLKIYGHRDVRIMNGGRKKWIKEGREVTTEIPAISKKMYTATDPDQSLRAYVNEISSTTANPISLVDVRSADEYSGKVLAPPGLPETCQRGGHVPGAYNIPWGKNVNEDGTFRSFEDLRTLYEPLGITSNKNIVAYCRIGERSSLTWFVLKYLLGYANVKNYDGSWTEWGNLVNAPVAQGGQP